jgi:hypothetical protein
MIIQKFNAENLNAGGRRDGKRHFRRTAQIPTAEKKKQGAWRESGSCERPRQPLYPYSNRRFEIFEDGHGH